MRSKAFHVREGRLKQLTDDEIDSGRYYTREVYYENNTDDLDNICGDPDNAPITVGLVGMHTSPDPADGIDLVLVILRACRQRDRARCQLQRRLYTRSERLHTTRHMRMP